MATRTATQSGLWSDTATWGGAAVPINGDAFSIPAGIVVKCDVDQSGMATGMIASVIDGLLHFDADTNTCLKMNGNLTGTGALYICERATVTGFTLTTGKTNTYQVARTLDVATVEDTLGAGYLDAVEELIETAIDVENAARVAQGLNEMMPDAVQTFIESTRAGLSLSQILAYVEVTQGSFYHDTVNDVLYIHCSDSADPSTHTMTVIEPINRPAAGSEYRCYNLWNSTGTIAMTGTPIIRMYGWYPEREWTQLSAGADLGATVLPPLDHDLGLQAGDKIQIGCGNINTKLLEGTANGLYTVSDYNPSTKVITLSAGLATARLAGDYVAIMNRPIKINRTSGATDLSNTPLDILIKGVALMVAINFPIPYTAWGLGTILKHCSVMTNAALGGNRNALIKDCVFGYSSAGYVTQNTNDSIIDRCIILGYKGIVRNSQTAFIKNSIIQNSENITSSNPGLLLNSIFINSLVINPDRWVMNNCIIQTEDSNPTLLKNFETEYNNCIFKSNTLGYFIGQTSILRNSLFEGLTELRGYLDSYQPTDQIESFDHNQLPGNYKAWMRGGKIETALDGSTPLPGRLILTCESADYPVFRDFPVLLPAYRTSTWQALTRKSFTGGSVKIELIDPANDPLIDSTAQPLATYSLPDQANTNLPLKLGYKSTKSMQAILRISAQNATGTVEIDTRLIENRVQHGR